MRSRSSATIAAAKPGCTAFDEITNIHVSAIVPRFAKAEQMAMLRDDLRQQQSKALFVDPTYMAMPSGWPKVTWPNKANI